MGFHVEHGEATAFIVVFLFACFIFYSGYLITGFFIIIILGTIVASSIFSKDTVQ